MCSKRLLPAVMIIAILAAVIGGDSALSETAPHAAQFQPVNIRITCAGDDVDDVNIRPWVAHVSQGQSQQLRWQLAGGGVGSVSIQPKSNSAWPFASTPPIAVTAGGPGTASGAITGGQGAYYYDIIADCGSGPTVIDPRMDIDP